MSSTRKNNSFHCLSRNKSGSAVTADLTPMLDTIFLIILLLLATLMNSSIVRGFPVNLPSFPDNSEIQKESNSIEISIDKDGSIYIGKRLIEQSELGEQLKQLAQNEDSCVIFLRADRKTEYGKVAALLGQASQILSNKKVILITE